VSISEAVNYAYQVAYNTSGLTVNILIDNTKEHYVLLDDIKDEL
jgi:hypothetical protein